MLANLNSFYLEADVASSQMASLKHSLELAEESLKLTMLRYQAGEVTVLEVVDAQTTVLQRAQRIRRRTGRATAWRWPLFKLLRGPSSP